MKTSTGYTRLQIALHWLIAVLIIAAYFQSEGMGKLLEIRIETGQTGAEGGTLHGMLGSLVFLLVLIRIVVRLRQGAPDALDGTAPLLAMASKWSHRAIYLLMVAVPVAGMTAWFGHKEDVGAVHEVLGNTLIFVALAHSLLAIYHHFVIKDGTLNRMRKPRN